MTVEVPATVLADPAWLADDLARAERHYGRADGRVLGTIRWYSASSVLVAPALEPWAHTGVAHDPALAAVTFDMHPDGRFLDARSDRVLGGDLATLGAALAEAVDAAVTTFAQVSGAPARALWAVAIDSIANRLLWAGSTTGEPDRAMCLAESLSEHMSTHLAEHVSQRMSAHGPERGSPVTRLPRPRFEFVGERPVLRRSSCCLIYEAPTTAAEKCVSCPRQSPAHRAARLRTLLGP